MKALLVGSNKDEELREKNRTRLQEIFLRKGGKESKQAAKM